jgi:hypothetical protein
MSVNRLEDSPMRQFFLIFFSPSFPPFFKKIDVEVQNIQWSNDTKYSVHCGAVLSAVMMLPYGNFCRGASIRPREKCKNRKKIK